jgi:hypothetical protein
MLSNTSKNASKKRPSGFTRLALLCVLFTAASWSTSRQSRAEDPTWLPAAVADVVATDDVSLSLESLTRTVVVGNVVHYKAVVRLGAGPYDTIGLHRVVQENALHHPVASEHGVMLLHGDSSSFETSFLLTSHSGAVPVGQALAVYLAQNGVDVWGVDRRWTFVPDSATDFSTLATMGFAQAISDTRIALALARRSRWRSGSGLGKMILGGWSRGGEISYAVANDEAVRPFLRRHVKGLMPIDVPIRYAPADADFRAAVCASYASSKALYDAGAYEDSAGAGAKFAASLDVTAPAAPSPLIPGLTNHQALLVLITQSFVLANPVPWFHFGAGTFSGGLPTGLQYTNFDYIRAWFENLPSFQARLETLDGFALVCETPNLPFDDNLGLITVPTLALGAAGGFGVAGSYSPTLLGSTDVTTQVISLHPPGDVTLDFGHADLMYADNAAALAWAPLLTWILAH